MPLAERAASVPAPRTDPRPGVLRLRSRAQFQALLSGPAIVRTRHFALHRRALDALPEGDPVPLLFAPAGATWFGAMTPKRWARRAVTRNAIRRQMYALHTLFAPRLGAGTAYLVRLRAGFAVAQFPSARSTALQATVRNELIELFERGLPS